MVGIGVPSGRCITLKEGEFFAHTGDGTFARVGRRRIWLMLAEWFSQSSRREIIFVHRPKEKTS